ncbi:GNAT family N-acetyltransferase [Aestuariivirga sp.]|uniref:GNAT family N-acetyltransferase n=1 Tax=Aestuariivirga sp. TaxID=2650926 RepID=UPI0039E23F48
MLIANWQVLDTKQETAPEALRAEWQALSDRALTPAPLNGPEFLPPLFTISPKAELLTARAAEGLMLALPVQRRGWPVPVLSSFVSPLTNSGLPMIDRDLGPAALQAIARRIGQPLMLTGIPASGPFWDALDQSGLRISILDRWERAALYPQGSFAQWFEEGFERKRRKEYRRLRARLSEQGTLISRSLHRHENVDPWAEALLDLEGAGWKGARGTALKADPAMASAFRTICRDLHAAGKLRFWSITLDGRTIASLFAVVEQGQAWLGKIAYDEALAKYSPGVLLILDATEALFEEGVTQADSCAIPDHPMINHLWRGRMPMADVIIAGETVSPFMFKATVIAERSRRRSRAALKSLFYTITRRHRS